MCPASSTPPAVRDLVEHGRPEELQARVLERQPDTADLLDDRLILQERDCLLGASNPARIHARVDFPDPL